MPTALIADDEPHLAAYLRDALARAWPELQIVHVAKNGVEAAERIAALRPDFAFLDIKMPGLTGLEVAQGIEAATRVVFVTAYDEFAVAAFEQQAVDYVLKPVKSERLAAMVERLKKHVAGDDGGLAAVLARLLVSGGGAAPARLRFVRAGQGELMHQIDVGSVVFSKPATNTPPCARRPASTSSGPRSPSSQRSSIPSASHRSTVRRSSTSITSPALGATS